MTLGQSAFTTDNRINYIMQVQELTDQRLDIDGVSQFMSLLCSEEDVETTSSATVTKRPKK